MPDAIDGGDEHQGGQVSLVLDRSRPPNTGRPSKLSMTSPRQDCQTAFETNCGRDRCCRSLGLNWPIWTS